MTYQTDDFAPAGTIPLHTRAGIAAALDANALTLFFAPEVSVAEREQRRADELRPVLFRPEDALPDDLLYTLYRGIAPTATAAVDIENRGLVYVALVLRPGTIGGELSRTRGHVNSPAPGTTIAYPEVHEVWHGRGILYLQNHADAGDDAPETVVIPLGPGDKAVVAPGWASLLANVGASPLVVGSWRCQECDLQHDPLADRGGMAHYLLAGATPEAPHFVPNPRYRAGLPQPSVAEPREIKDFGLKKDEPMLTTFRRNPDFLRFMLRPQDFTAVWPTLYDRNG